MLSDRCYVCLSVFSETLAYRGQTVRWIKMKIGVWVGLGLATLCYMETQFPFPKGALPPIFGPYLLWPNGWVD